MSFYHNNKPLDGQFTADGLVISFNTASTSVIPILNGKGILSNAKRYILCAGPPGQRSNDSPLQDPMGILTGHRVSPEVDPIKVPNVPNACHILPSECKSDALAAGDPRPHRYI